MFALARHFTFLSFSLRAGRPWCMQCARRHCEWPGNILSEISHFDETVDSFPFVACAPVIVLVSFRFAPRSDVVLRARTRTRAAQSRPKRGATSQSLSSRIYLIIFIFTILPGSIIVDLMD